MFQLYLYFELSFAQIVFSHYTPSLLHIPKMMMNVVVTLQPTAKYSTFFSMFFSTPLQLLFFSTIPLPPPIFVCAHSSVLPFPLLFIIVFQLHSLHSYYCEFQNFKNAHNFQQQMQTAFDGYPIFPIVEHFTHYIHFFICCYLLINTWSLKLIRPITTSLCVFCTTMWKHLASSLWVNIANFIFWLFHICNLSTLSVLNPFRSPYTPFVDCAHLSVDYENTSANYTNLSIDYAHNFEDCVNTLDDRTNVVADSADTLDISSLNHYIPNPTLLKLLLIYK
jgi:hypothetical protein